MFRGYVKLGDVEIVNNDRVLSYMKGNKSAGAVPLKGRNTQVTKACECEPLLPLYCDLGSGPSGEYISPQQDDAPWYDIDVADSNDFAGFFCEKVTGFDSLFTRKVFDDAIEGGALGPLRLKARRMQFTGWIRARTCCAADYGLDWLTSALTDAARCEGCEDGEMYAFRCCPPANTCALTTVSTFEFDCDTALTGCERVLVPTTTIDGTLAPPNPDSPGIGVVALGNGIYQFQFYENDNHSNLIRDLPGSGGTTLDGIVPTFATASPNTVLQLGWFGIDGVSQVANNFAFSIPEELIVQGTQTGGTFPTPFPGAFYQFNVDLKIEASCTGLQDVKDALLLQIQDYSNSYGLGGPINVSNLAPATSGVAAIEPINITNPPVTCEADVTITDDGSGLYTIVVDDAQLSGAVSTQAGALNNLDGFIPTCLDGSDANAVLSWEINAGVGVFRFDIPLPAITGPIVYAPSGDGNTATFQVNALFDLLAGIDCAGREGLLDETLNNLAAWVTTIGSGVTAQATNISGRCKTLQPNTVDPLDVNRTLLGVALVDGPKVIEESGRCSEEGCSAATCGYTNKKVQFTLATGNPYLFGDITYCIEDQPFDDSITYVNPVFCPNPCPDVASTIVIPDCGPATAEPPSPSLVGTDCYCEPLATYRACCKIDNILDWQEASGFITIEAGSTDLRNLSIKAFENPTGVPCPCQPETDEFWQCNDTCSNIQIPFLPEGSTLTLDSRTKTASITFSGGEVVQGLRFVQAANGEPFDFFNVGNCASLCLVVAVDCTSFNPDARVSIGTAPRFLTSA